MKSFAATTTLLAAAAIAANAQHNTTNIQPLIVSGTKVPAGTHTYTVGLRETAAGRDFCGGSLIAPKHVLTAAHCQAGPIKYVSVGTHFLSGTKDGEQIPVTNITPHPEYDSSTHSHDWMILELAHESKFTPVALASADTDATVGTKATVMGWGTTSEGGKQSDVLLGVDVNVVDNADCANKLSNIDDSMLCAGGIEGEDSCQGDSGGPCWRLRPAPNEARCINMAHEGSRWPSGYSSVIRPRGYASVISGTLQSSRT